MGSRTWGTPCTPTRAAGSPCPAPPSQAVAAPLQLSPLINYLLMKSYCTWGTGCTSGTGSPSASAASPHLSALEELARLEQVGESFVSRLS